MSLDRSLKTKPAALNQHRNVLTRAERIERLTAESRFNADEESPLGLLKVGNRQIVTGKKKKEKKEEEEAVAKETEAEAEAPAAE